MPSFTLPDPYEGWSESQLKQRCRDLCMAVDRYQHIAMALLDPGGFDALPAEWRDELTRLRAAYDD
jgi:hypothetical protein